MIRKENASTSEISTTAACDETRVRSLTFHRRFQPVNERLDAKKMHDWLDARRGRGRKKVRKI